MIQRIQSILILLSSVLLGLEFVFPFATSTAQKTGFFSDAIYNVSDSPILLGAVTLGAVLSLVAIFLFNNRKLQMTFNWIAIIACIVVCVAAYLLLTQNQSGDLKDVSVGIGAFLPAISVILLLVANRFISKDDNLVKSMDRLR